MGACHVDLRAAYLGAYPGVGACPGDYGIHVMRIHKMLISYVRLDHMLHSINYGIQDFYVGNNKIFIISNM